LAASWPSRTSEVCTINTSGFDLRQGQRLQTDLGLSAGALVAFADHGVALLQERGHPWRLSDEAKPGGWTT